MSEEDVDLKVRIAADKTGIKRVTLTIAALGVEVFADDQDLRSAVIAAAENCVEALTGLGAIVTRAEIIFAIEDALERSVLHEPNGVNTTTRGDA